MGDPLCAGVELTRTDRLRGSVYGTAVCTYMNTHRLLFGCSARVRPRKAAEMHFKMLGGRRDFVYYLGNE